MTIDVKPSWIATDNADNAAATATKAAVAAQRHYVTSVAGGFDAAVSGATLILKSGSTELGRWNVYDTFALVFPSPIEVAAGTVANLVLEASGTAGITGAATMTGYTL